MLGHNTFLPVFVLISEAKSHDQKLLETLDTVKGLIKGSVVVVDRAYNDYEMLFNWNNRGITFVCRAKENMNYKVVEELLLSRPVGRPTNIPTDEEKSLTAKAKSHVISDQVITLSGPASIKAYPETLRLATFWVEEPDKHFKTRKSREMKFFTNNFKLSAFTIAELYRSRWQVESIFKLIKQKLKIKSFLGTSANAVKIQLYIALITFVVIRFLQSQAKTNWCFSHLIILLRLSLHLYRDLLAWLNDGRNQKQNSSKGRTKRPARTASSQT